MLYTISIKGETPIIMHSGSGIDPATEINQEKAEITAKRGSNRTAADDTRLKFLETAGSLWLDENKRVTIPQAAFRACLETAARKLKQGPLVREGLIVVNSTFYYDNEKYGKSLEEVCTTAQFTTPVVVQRARIMRTRAKFDTPWTAGFYLDCDDELIDTTKLETWLDIAGRRIGLGDWRPEKSGMYGRFSLKEISVREGS